MKVATASQADQPKAEVKTIFECKAELGLTDKQESDMRRLLGNFEKSLSDKRKELSGLQTELGEMLKKRASLGSIRRQLEKISRVQVDASYMDVETSRKVEDVMTPVQLARWKKMQSEFQEKLLEEAREAQKKQDASGNKNK